jgi:SAM-dependent methyltransferase
MADARAPDFYERFWRDADYTLAYARDSAERDRYPAIRAVWGDRPLPARVLDFGCGNGVLTHWMHRRGFGREILGVDVSRTGVEFATRSFAGDGLRFEAITGTPAGNFDLVVSSHVLEHLPDSLAALRALRSLAPLFIFEVPLEHAVVPNLLTALRGRPRTDNDVGHLHFWHERGFRRLLQDTGYTILDSHRYASAPFSPYTAPAKRALERIALSALGLGLYGWLMATHFAVLAEPS